MLTPNQFTAKQNQRFADNEYQRITEESFRDFADDIRATFVALAAANVPDYEPARYYAAGFLIRHSFAGATPVFLEATTAGQLPAPTAAAGDANWRAALSPASGPALSQAGTVAALRHAQNFWVPGRLYILRNRVDGLGQPGPDVYVRALGKGLLEPEAYIFSDLVLGIEPVRVRYDLDTDTIEPLPQVDLTPILATQEEHTEQLLLLRTATARVFSGGVGKYTNDLSTLQPGDTVYFSNPGDANLLLRAGVTYYTGGIPLAATYVVGADSGVVRMLGGAALAKGKARRASFAGSVDVTLEADLGLVSDAGEVVRLADQARLYHTGTLSGWSSGSTGALLTGASRYEFHGIGIFGGSIAFDLRDTAEVVARFTKPATYNYLTFLKAPTGTRATLYGGVSIVTGNNGQYQDYAYQFIASVTGGYAYLRSGTYSNRNKPVAYVQGGVLEIATDARLPNPTDPAVYVVDGTSGTVRIHDGAGVDKSRINPALTIEPLPADSDAPAPPASYTDAQARNAAASLFNNNLHTGISFTYDAANNRIVAKVTGGGSTTPTSSNTAQIANNSTFQFVDIFLDNPAARLVSVAGLANFQKLVAQVINPATNTAEVEETDLIPNLNDSLAAAWAATPVPTRLILRVRIVANSAGLVAHALVTFSDTFYSKSRNFALHGSGFRLVGNAFAMQAVAWTHLQSEVSANGGSVQLNGTSGQCGASGSPQCELSGSGLLARLRGTHNGASSYDRFGFTSALYPGIGGNNMEMHFYIINGANWRVILNDTELASGNFVNGVREMTLEIYDDKLIWYVGADKVWQANSSLMAPYVWPGAAFYQVGAGMTNCTIGGQAISNR